MRKNEEGLGKLNKWRFLGMLLMYVVSEIWDMWVQNLLGRYIKRDGTQIRERIDWDLASTTWSNLFPSAKVFHLSSSTSDHSQLSIHLDMRLML